MFPAYTLLMLINRPEGDLCSKLLEYSNCVVVRAQSNNECLKLILESSFDLIVLDEEAAPLDGEELLTMLRRLSDASILVIGSGDESRHINTLNQGADLYLKRPIQEAVFQANAKMLLWRRYLTNQRRPNYGPTLTLSHVERRLLACLLAHGGKIVTFEELLHEVWGGKVGYETLKLQMRQLKRKLVRLGTRIDLISIRGVGHRIFPTNTDT